MIKRSLGLLVLAVLLCLAITAEVAAWVAPVTAPSDVSVATTPRPIAAVDVEAPVSAWVSAILARPLFIPGRRAPAEAGVTAVGLPRLAGIIVGPAGGRAIFAPVDGGKANVLAPGARIGGFVVEAIEPGIVTLSGPDGRHVLRPAYDVGGSPVRPVATALTRAAVPK